MSKTPTNARPSEGLEGATADYMPGAGYVLDLAARDLFPQLTQLSGRPTVLVADDEPSIAELLGELLESVGYQVLLATNGRTALAIARREHPALVLTDRHMPELDGIEFVRLLHASPVTSDIPVVLMSSTRPDLESVGNVPFLAKPFDLDDVLRAVVQHTASAQSVRLAGRD